MKTQLITVATAVLAAAGAVAESTQATEATKKTVEVQVTRKGFEPSSIEVAPGTDLTLEVTRKTKVTCAKEITVAGRETKTELPLNETVKVHLGKVEKGEIKFGCGMGQMLSAMIFVK